MGRKKIIGNCAIEGCLRILDSRGLCTMHYHRLVRNGTTDLINRRGKKSHPLYSTYRDRVEFAFPEEWKDFWKFVEDVGERPSKNHYMYKIDKARPYSKDNFRWLEHIKRRPQESELEWRKRKWRQRLKNRPSLQEYGRIFRELLKDTGITLEEYSRIYKQKYEFQNGVCAICFNSETTISNRNGKLLRLSMDHNHKTLQIRELLCRRCNQSLGSWTDSIELFENAITYLKKYENSPTGIKYNMRNKVDFLHKNLAHGLNHLCEICNQKETRINKAYGKRNRLSVDHNHQTNEIRGLLCTRCNTSIGNVQDSTTILQSMITYLQKHN